MLDPTPLETVVGRPLLKLEEIYKKEDGETYVMARPPLKEHAKRVVKKCWAEPKNVVIAAKTVPNIVSYAYNNYNKNKEEL